MLTAFIRAFRTPDLRKKLLFTLFIIGVFRLGSTLPTPGISVAAVRICSASAHRRPALFELVNLFSGGALLRLTVFALGIMPYITASIILQLLAVVIPRLETLRQEGQTRPGEDHPVHQVPHRRPGHPAVHRHRRAGQVGRAVPRLHQVALIPTRRSSPSPRW